MKLLNWRKWKWNYEIAPMYMLVEAKPFTEEKQDFQVLCGLTSKELFYGDRLPQVGEFVTIPTFKGRFKVSDIRASYSLGRNEYSRSMEYKVNLDPEQFGDEEYWRNGRDRMRKIEGWSWSANYEPSNYKNLGFTPSDWTNKELKFKEREFVLNWTKNGNYFMTPYGDEYLMLDPKHRYLFDWFPEVKRHLDDLFYLT